MTPVFVHLHDNAMLIAVQDASTMPERAPAQM